MRAVGLVGASQGCPRCLGLPPQLDNFCFQALAWHCREVKCDGFQRDPAWLSHSQLVLTGSSPRISSCCPGVTLELISANPQSQLHPDTKAQPLLCAHTTVGFCQAGFSLESPRSCFWCFTCEDFRIQELHPGSWQRDGTAGGFAEMGMQCQPWHQTHPASLGGHQEPKSLLELVFNWTEVPQAVFFQGHPFPGSVHHPTPVLLCSPSIPQ